ncbi:SAM-dependent methyltransferase [Yinghuangia seranimata]|uniref:SAM-dependent methyltransferase n=1 Tax=Yinghuangia seranimata TaxID=408067 RepID=UPI00248B23C7|nr:SAM-dependent methyltransferase [Yinghuangia seranimata]MDI2132517.1 SAM-dependent methyltransferase [Yinghuangia seranimata]
MTEQQPQTDPLEQWTPSGIDVSVPSIARVYDAVLGGKDNFASDRAAAAELLAAVPDAQRTALINRQVLSRGVRFMAEQGIDQFIDLGSGLPSAENTHQVAQRHNPDAAVVYVDIDPIVLAHGRAILADSPRTRVVTADATEPERVLALPEVRELIDFDRPVGLLMVAIVHHLEDAQDPAGIVKTYLDALPSGSYLFLTHFFANGSREAEDIERVLHGAHNTGRFRSREEIEGFFAGLDVVEPGIGYLPLWRPEGPVEDPLPMSQQLLLGGIGKKP